MSRLLTRLAFEQAAEYGVVKDLIRISVGIEDVDILIEKVKRALNSSPKESMRKPSGNGSCLS